MPVIKGIVVDPKDVTRIGKWLKNTPKLVNAAMRKAASAEANEIMRVSQDIVPVVTGTLKRSKFIGRAKSTSSQTAISFGYEVKLVGKDDYSAYVEHGDSKFNVKFTGRFYMRRAVSMTRNGRKKRIAQHVRAAIKKGK